MGRRSYFYRQHSINSFRNISESDLSIIYEAIDDAVDKTSTLYKSENELLGEIYTRARSKVIHSPITARSFVYGLRHIAGGDEKTISLIRNRINLALKRKNEQQVSADDLELSVIAMFSCLQEASSINKESSGIVSRLDRIETEMKGEF